MFNLAKITVFLGLFSLNASADVEKNFVGESGVDANLSCNVSVIYNDTGAIKKAHIEVDGAGYLVQYCAKNKGIVKNKKKKRLPTHSEPDRIRWTINLENEDYVVEDMKLEKGIKIKNSDRVDQFQTESTIEIFGASDKIKRVSINSKFIGCVDAYYTCKNLEEIVSE